MRFDNFLNVVISLKLFDLRMAIIVHYESHFNDYQFCSEVHIVQYVRITCGMRFIYSNPEAPLGKVEVCDEEAYL